MLLRKILFITAALFCLIWAESAIALVIGAALALTFGNPFSELTKTNAPKLLSASVVGLGAGMNLITVAHVGAAGIGYTVITISLAFLFGLSLARFLKIEENTGVLVTVGTAICGGSAIAAVSPVLRAKAHEISVSLGLVFLLNALALLIFPSIGHALGLSQTQFGLWSALAIHDTSSVVGASLRYGPQALQVGTTVKLARALWIVPVTFVIGLVIARRRPTEEAGASKPKRPWFILGFVIMAALVTFIPALQAAGHLVETGAKRALVLTLFLIGTNLNKTNLKAVGFAPFLQGACLWILMAGTTLFAIVQGWIRLT